MDKPMTFNEWLGTQGNMVLLHANCCRIAFEGGQQSQQAKVEELQEQLNEYIFVAETLDEMYVKEVKSSDELQKRVDAAKHYLGNIFTGDSIEDECHLKDLLDILDGKIVAELEQALKGEG
ncbi:hypothetical protein [Acinetobacter baumannii]|uniref:hypothetical protein n=1 Tax=Acinetobacter baumannii TaxID=470 RepID=UPI0034CD3A87